MKVYHYSENNNSIGPLSLEELKTKAIKRDTLVWHEGLETWKKAEEIAELATIFPPRLTQERKTAPKPLPANTPDEVDFLDIFSLISLFVLLAGGFIQILRILGWLPDIKFIDIGVALFLIGMPVILALRIKNELLRLLGIVTGIITTGILLCLHLIIWFY